MGILNVFTKKNSSKAEKPESAQTAARPVPGMQGTQPGSRISAVIERMYRLVVSVDLDRNSCFIECGEPKIGSIVLPTKGTYDAFLAAMKECVAEENRSCFLESFNRSRLTDHFLEGKGVLSELMTVDGVPIEVRAERIPEAESGASRVRCCLFFRNASGLDDDGQSEEKKRAGREEGGLTEEDKLISSMFTGCYEISLEKNTLVGYKIVKGRFVKADERMALVNTVKALIQNGTIHPQSAEVYKNFCTPGFLEKKTSAGPYEAEVLLRRPRGTGYRWYGETVFPVGKNFRICRRDIDELKKAAVSEQQAEENEKFFKYNRTMLRTVASLVEFRNADTGNHLTHVNEITRILLEDIANRSPKYELTKPKIRLYTEASTMHDIGKVTVADSILNKPGKLTEEEREQMKDHTKNGALIIERMEADTNEELYELCRDIALHHHERWDGGGYPEGLKGDEISIGAQAVSIADAFDALASKRTYKEAVSCDEAFRMITGGECGVFNPRLMESLKSCLPKIKAVYERSEQEKENGEQ